MRPIRTIAVTSLAVIAMLGPLPAGAQAGQSHASGTRHGVAPVAVRPHASRPQRAPNFGLQMFRSTNFSRHRYGLRPLARNLAASRAAARHSLAMARGHRLFHSSSMRPYLRGVGRWTSWGENIGMTSGSVADLQRAFMASSVHRTHILSRAFRHVAVGAVMYRNRLWVTLVFYG